MKLLASLANTLWLAGGRRASRRFAAALANPETTQDAVLRAQLAKAVGSHYGKEHDFGAIHTYADFAQRVPLATYQELAPYIERIRRGEANVLGSEKVTHLVPTSGSTGARKLIPFTRSLSRAFDAAVAPWMHDLVRARPGIRYGPAYWSVSPLAGEGEEGPSAVPIGFADDAEYLGRAIARLLGKVFAVPSSARLVREADAFWPLVLLALLRQRELRLISVWHPTFLELLVGAAEEHWSDLLAVIESGANPWIGALPAEARPAWKQGKQKDRAAELRRLGKNEWPRWWPRLEVVSSWGDQAAQGGWQRITARVPGVLVQPKGLLATEAVVTVPIGEQFPLAVTSHFFEFLDSEGEVRRAQELERGRHYEVVVSNGGGLWRYRLGDLVECCGHLAATPTLRFLGRAGNVSDLRGEKLAEPFVAEALRSLWQGRSIPSVATLRAWEEGKTAGYELLLSNENRAESSEEIAAKLEQALRANPHYEIARRLGQLEPLRVVLVGFEEAEALFREAQSSGGLRLGDIKPKVLVQRPGTGSG